MGLNVNGGPLEWTANIDVDAAFEQLDQLKAKFSQALQVNPNTSMVDLLKTRLEELTRQAQVFSDGLKGVTQPQALKQLNEGLLGTKTQISVINELLKQLGAGGFKSTGDGADNASQKVQSLRGQLNAVRSELGLMLKQQADGGPFDPAKFEELTEKGRQLSNAYNNVNKELHLASSNVAGIAALREGFRGLIGSAESLVGVMGLFTSDQQKAEEITKNLVALMSILNGVEEVGNILAKNSALNAYLRRTALFSQAEGAVAATAAEAALTGAEEGGIAATEAASAAQWGLNAAMLANPVGAILIAIVGLIGAWELYTHTIGAATEEEERHKLAAEALQEALKKSADEVAKEEASLTSLIITAKNENLTRAQRQQAINELNAKYPQYLSNINLENINTQGVNETLKKQIELLKAKAIAQAAEQVYAEKLKAVFEAQNEVNRITSDGTTKMERFFAAVKGGFAVSGKEQLLLDAMTKLNDKTKDADATLQTFIKTQTESGQAMQSGSEAIQVQIDKLQKLGELTGNPLFYKGLLDGLEQQKRILKSFETKPFDPSIYEKDRALALAAAQYKVDVAKKGTLQEIEARKELIKVEHELDLEDQRKFKPDGTPQVDTSDPFNPRVKEEALRAMAKYKSDLQAINDELISRTLQNAASAATAVVLQMQAIGQQSSEAYFNAQETAIKKAAAEQINAAKDNAGEIRKIQAQLNLDLSNLEIERKKTRLQHEQEIQQVLLNNVRVGSQQELDIKLKMLDLSRDIELAAAGKDQEKINELNSNTEKAKFELKKAYAIEAAETETNIQIAHIETNLAAARVGSQKELILKKQLIDQKTALEEENLQKSVKNIDLLEAKTLEIHAKGLEEKKRLDDEYNQKQLDLQLKSVQARTDLENAKFNQIISSPTTTPGQKFNAQKEVLQNNIAGLQEQQRIITANVIAGKGDLDKLETQSVEIDAKLQAMKGELINIDSQRAITGLKNAGVLANALASAFGNIATQLKEVDPALASLLDQLNSVTVIAGDAISALASFASGDVVGGIAGVVKTIGGIISSIAGDRAKELAQRKEIQDFLDKIFIGEQEINLLYEERARQQVLINKLRLQGMQDEKTLLQQQKEDIAQQFRTVFDELQKETFQQIKHIASAGVIPAFDVLVNTPLFGKSFDEIEQLFIKGQLVGKAKDLFEELQKIKQSGVDVDALLQQNKDKTDQLFTGTTAQNIADTIRQGLESGKRSVSDFADTFQNLMQQAILSSFEAKTIEPLIADFFKQFAEISENNGGNLTAEQILQLKEKFGKDVEQITKQFEQLQQLTGISITGNGSSTNSLTGAIKGMTEQTAEIIAGQFGGLRITALSQLNILTQQMAIQNNIQANTADTVSRLDTLLNKFSSYETGAAKLSIK